MENSLDLTEYQDDPDGFDLDQLISKLSDEEKAFLIQATQTKASPKKCKYSYKKVLVHHEFTCQLCGTFHLDHYESDELSVECKQKELFKQTLLFSCEKCRDKLYGMTKDEIIERALYAIRRMLHPEVVNVNI